MSLLGKIVAGLGGPINRVGFLVFAIGLIFLLVSVAWYIASDYYPHIFSFLFENYVSHIFDFDRSAEYGWQILARIALLMMALGGVAAWFYDATIGRAVRWWRKLSFWIMNGGRSREEPVVEDKLVSSVAEEPAKKEPLPIGGWLWFPALWTVTNPLIGLAMYEALGVIPLLLSIPNAFLFWMKSRFYPWFFLAQNCLLVWLLAAAHIAPGSGFAASVVASVALFVSRRSKDTFVK